MLDNSVLLGLLLVEMWYVRVIEFGVVGDLVLGLCIFIDTRWV